MKTTESLAIINPSYIPISIYEKLALGVIAIAFLLFSLAFFNIYPFQIYFQLLLSVSFLTIGSIWYTFLLYSKTPSGIKNNGVFFKNISNRGVIGWMLGVILTGFYILLYWFPTYLEGLIRLFDPLSYYIRGKAADNWFLYGSFYTIAVLLLGFKFGYKYRHNQYQLVRTFSVCFFQLIFAYLIPAFLIKMNSPEFYFTYFWPLKKEMLFPNDLQYLASSGNLGVFMVYWTVLLALVGVPILTYFFGKRWYCSWVCGCGALAETAGDAFRHLSDKSLNAWKIERYLIYSVLVLVVILTILLWVNSLWKGNILGSFSQTYAKTYGFLIGSIFSGVIGTGFYPILGSRVWCRFGCPQAAILGILQKYFSRFRITTNGGQCISCGNCSTYCEMGIDVRAYAQKGEDILRASCVGCGICSAVCPRGVLKLENKK